MAERDEVGARQRALVDRIRAGVAAIQDVDVVGDPDGRLPHLVTFSCLYVDGESLVTELDRLGYAVASGSACTASTLTPSHVLAAMGALTHGNVRVSLTRDTTAEDVDGLLAVLPGRGGAAAGGGAAVTEVELDCRGQVCPMPVIALAKAVPDLEVGDTVVLLADDPAAAADIPAWCRMKQQEYLGADTTADGTPRFRVRRAERLRSGAERDRWPPRCRRTPRRA